MGKRRDGTKVKNLDGLHSLMPHIKPLRADSDIYINQKIDMEALIKYYEELKQDEKYKDITYFHLFCMAIGKLIYNRPQLNRFVVNKTYYDRNKVTISFVAKKDFTDESEESFQILQINENDNIFSLSEQIIGRVQKIRTNQSHNVDKLMDTVGKMPRWVKNIFIALASWADKRDLLPHSLIKDFVYYSTVIVSNLGSIGCGAIYHNLTEFGTNSILITIGEIKDEIVVVDGKPTVRKMCEFGVNADERIADGFYYVKSLQLFEYLLQNPKLLEEEASKKIELPKKHK